VTIGSVIGAIVIGLIIGALGRLIVPGKQKIPIWLTIVVGIAAAFVGTFIAGPSASLPSTGSSSSSRCSLPPSAFWSSRACTAGAKRDGKPRARRS
jgi:uncharacterized membrane protein YeaQ/YmgE (transglycosylase-associated protein family)